MFESIRITALGHGILLGAQYWAPLEAEEEDLHELSIYLFLFCIQLTWR